jgi:hypothetical protein
MNNAALRKRRTIRWARYFNRYDHIPLVVIGGWSAVRAMTPPHNRTWGYLRNQGRRSHG